MPSSEVPAIVGAEASGSGTATITFAVTKDGAGNITSSTATFVVNLSGFPAGTPINIAHIHQGAKGKSGNVVLALFGNPPAKHSGCVSATKALISAISKSPAAYYVNVHTKKYPTPTSTVSRPRPVSPVLLTAWR